MRTEEPRPVRLVDYRTPDWLVDTVGAILPSIPHATRVRRRCRCGRAEHRRSSAPGVHGDSLTLRSVAIDGSMPRRSSMLPRPIA